jgi:hypothetical protein
MEQAEAAAYCARDRLSLAAHEPDLARRRQLMKVAVEFALRSVTISWGTPTTKPERLWELFGEPISALLPSEIRTMVAGLRTDGCDELMTAGQAAAAVEAILELRDAGPPSTWSPPPRCRVGWSGLSPSERHVLHDALRAATAMVAGAQLWLFGSRATGTATENSDYDLCLIVPDTVPTSLHGMAVGNICSAVRSHGARTDHHLVVASSFDNPTDEDRVLVTEVVSYGFRVPPSGGIDPRAESVPLP